jgi:antirestriction protein ArdC
VALIPLSKLKQSPRNARKTPHSKTEIEALAASIHAKGMLQNLVVEPECKELVAEIGASLLGAHLHLAPHHIHDHASYIGHWMRLLAGDTRAFLHAAAQAQLAVDWLLARSPAEGEAEAIHVAP